MTGERVMTMAIPGICGFGLHFQLDGFRLIYTCMAVLMWTVSGVFSGEYMAHYEKRRRYYLFFWITFLATVGVFLSEDLYTTFIFFEIMSLTSYVWVAFDERKESLKAAETYLAVAVIGGMVMLMGLFLLYDMLGTLKISELQAAAARAVQEGRQGRLYAAGLLLLFGFGAKAGCFPLHIWLPKAHPVAPAPASALLSGILTKTGIFGVIVVSCRLFGGDGAWGLLIFLLGLVTMFLGALLAMFSINLKKTLACSSVSQIGFILVGVGMCGLLTAAGENPAIAARGTFLHMVNHSLFKLVLFLCAGVVYMDLHELDLNKIRGFGKGKPFLAFCFLMGALGIGGIPGWSGYVSKTLLHESIVGYQELVAEGLAAAGGASGVGLAAAGGASGVGLAASGGASSIGLAAGSLTGPLSGTSLVVSRLTGSPIFWTFAEWVFLLTGGMTVSYMLKLSVALFVEEDPGLKDRFTSMNGHYMRMASKAVLLIPAILILGMGLTPSLTMDRLADMGQGFFLAGGMEHKVHYFAMANLKGGLISIGIGCLLYLLVIRKLLMAQAPQMQTGKAARSGGTKKAGGAGQACYVDRWPQFLDLETMLYRPILQALLPNVCGTVLGWLDRYLIQTLVTVFLAVSGLVCRAMDQLADGAILLARRTTHRQVRVKPPKKEKDLIERWLETGLDGVAWESFSFGLMLFCIGLCLTLGYLLYTFFRYS